MKLSGKLSLEVIDSDDEFGKLEKHWSELLRSTNQSSPFLLWVWMHTWWKVYKTKDTSLSVLVFRRSNKIIAIAPFYFRITSKIPRIKKVYLLGTGEPERMEVCSEYLDFIVLNEYRDKVSVEILRYFSEIVRDWATIDVTRILEDSLIFKEFTPLAAKSGLAIKSNICGYRYYVNLQNTWDEYFSALSKRAQRSITVANKRLKAAGNFEVSCVSDEDKIDGLMDELTRLHSQRWDLKKKAGAFSSQEFKCFHKEVSKLLFRDGQLQLTSIKLKGEYISILYNIKNSDEEYYYQSGFNIKKYKSLSPGILAHSEAIKLAIGNKYKKYDFMMGAENSYKSNYNCDTDNMFNVTFYNKSFLAKIMFILTKLRS